MRICESIEDIWDRYREGGWRDRQGGRLGMDLGNSFVVFNLLWRWRWGWLLDFVFLNITYESKDLVWSRTRRWDPSRSHHSRISPSPYHVSTCQKGKALGLGHSQNSTFLNGKRCPEFPHHPFVLLRLSATSNASVIKAPLQMWWWRVVIQDFWCLW